MTNVIRSQPLYVSALFAIDEVAIELRDRRPDWSCPDSVDGLITQLAA